MARIQQSQDLRTVEPAYAILGVAADHGLHQTLVALDSGLHTGLVDRARVAEMLEACRDWPGHHVMTSAAGLADSKSESPGESLTRLLLHTLGYAVRSQADIVAQNPAFRARADFLLVTHRVVIEFDGMTKYAAKDGSGNHHALVCEKAREDGLRALGYEVVRLVWADLRAPDNVRAAIEAACRRAERVA